MSPGFQSELSPPESLLFVSKLLKSLRLIKVEFALVPILPKVLLSAIFKTLTYKQKGST